MPYKSRESAIAAARKVAAQLDREPDAAPEKRHALATRLETITSRTTPAGWHAHPWNYESDAIERERAALYSKAGDVLNLALGTAVSFVVSLVVIGWLLRYIANHNFKPFAVYRIVAGLFVLVWALWLT